MVESTGQKVEANVAEVEVVDSENQFRLWQQQRAEYKIKSKKSLRARYSYGIIFLITNLVAWFIRDYGERFLPVLHCEQNFFLQFNDLHSRKLLCRILLFIVVFAADSRACGTEEAKCFHTMGVLRVSLGCFVSFASQK